MSLLPFRKLLVPLVLLILAVIARGAVKNLQTDYLQLLQAAPYVLLGIVCALCFYYNRARLFVAVLSLILLYFLIQSQLQTSLEHPRTMLVFSLISVLHPLSLLLLLILPERGLRNRYGLVLLLLLLLTCLLATFLTHYFAVPLALTFSQWMPTKVFSAFVISLPAALAYLSAISAAVYCLYKSAEDFPVMVFAIGVSCFVLLLRFDLDNISMVLFIALAFSLIVSMLGTSYDMAYRDDLTGLLGRRALNDRLTGLGGKFVIAMLDVDHFKKFNDTHGHDVGDDVLKMVAMHIAAVKGGATAYRYGGEEFCVVFAGRDLAYCEPYLEQLRHTVEVYRMTLRDTSQRARSQQAAEQRRGRRAKTRNEKFVSVTISIGMAEVNDKHYKADDVLKAADKALYRAKGKGRNCLSR